MSEWYLGEIRMWAGIRIPDGWHVCDGTALPIAGNDALYALLGTTYGGDGITNFALPDLRGRVAVGQGAGPNLTPRAIASSGGSETVTLSGSQIPAHTHVIKASTANGTTNDPTNTVWANTGSTAIKQFSTTVTDSTYGAMNAAALSNNTGGQPHNNLMPSLAINFIIALIGIFPTQS